MDQSPNLSLPYIAPSQAQKHVTHNEALRLLDARVQVGVVDRDLGAPPSTPADGDRYIVAMPASGGWLGQAGNIAAFQDGAWTFHVPRKGWLAWIADEELLTVWDGMDWFDVSGPDHVNPVNLVGVNASADAANRLTVSSPATLFDHEGAGHQVKINKIASANTASLLFQTGYSGRAEIGLCADDDIRLKVSPDGSAWHEALRTDRSTGETVIGNLRVSRDIVQNVLPDSGRFNGNANNNVFSSIAYSAPTYLAAVAGGSISSLAKFIHNNTDYGGSAGSLNAEVKALIDKIRAPADRRYGPEWYVVEVDNSTTSLTGSRTIGGTAYGYAMTSPAVALPNRFTVGFYVKAKTGTVAIAVDGDKVMRAAVDGAAVASGIGASPVVLANADGWKHVCLELAPNAYSYDLIPFRLYLPLSGELWFAMPKVVFGHMQIEPGVGVLMNVKMYG